MSANATNNGRIAAGARLRWLLCAAVLVVAWLAPSTAAQRPATQPALVADGIGANGRLELTINRSAVLTTTSPVETVSIAQPEIADCNVLSPTSVLVTAKKAGNTQLILLDRQGKRQSVEISVRLDMQMVQDEMKRLFPSAKIEASLTNNVLVLSGRVPTLQVAEQAAAVGSAYSQRVLNLLEVGGGQQVMLKVRFAEVSRQATSALGINGAIVGGSFFGGSNIGQVNPSSLIPGDGSRIGDTPTPQGLTLSGDQAINPSVTMYAGGQIGSVYVQAFIAALRQNSLLRVLAEPNLVTVSGQEASFLAGGEYPVPVTQGGSGDNNAAITIEYKEFGVRLNFVPVVVGKGRIRMKVAPEVSDLDYTSGVLLNGFRIPGLVTRKLQTTVEMGEGQTFALAGLLQSGVVASKDSVPGLGDLPVLGSLFRSVRYQRRETELVVMVTPYLVDPMNPHDVPPMPGEMWRHPTEYDLLLKRDMGSDTGGSAAEADGPPRQFYGPYGFVPATGPAKTTGR